MGKFSMSSVLAVAALLCACSATQPVTSEAGTGAAMQGDVVDAGSCNAQAAQAFAGQAPGDDVQAQARAAAGATGVRVLTAKQPTTREFLAGRLNLRLGDDGMIASAYCG